MPELPEVEVVRAGLAAHLDGAVVGSVAVHDSRSLRRHPGPVEDFAQRLIGRRMLPPARRGKFLWIPLEAGDALLAHLGMSGQLLLREADAAEARHTRIRIGVTTAAGPLRVDFADQRLFGSLALDELVSSGDHDDLVPAQARHIARDPLDPLFDESRFLVALARRGTAIKRALLDQQLLSGVGNIYADEALWAARIHPEQPAGSLSRARARQLLAEVRAVFLKALAEGGTSFDEQYRNVNGEAGYFAHSLNAYGRGGLPCPRCGGPIERVSFMNRGSHFCPRCQRRR